MAEKNLIDSKIKELKKHFLRIDIIFQTEKEIIEEGVAEFAAHMKDAAIKLQDKKIEKDKFDQLSNKSLKGFITKINTVNKETQKRTQVTFKEWDKKIDPNKLTSSYDFIIEKIASLKIHPEKIKRFLEMVENRIIEGFGNFTPEVVEAKESLAEGKISPIKFKELIIEAKSRFDDSLNSIPGEIDNIVKKLRAGKNKFIIESAGEFLGKVLISDKGKSLSVNNEILESNIPELYKFLYGDKKTSSTKTFKIRDITAAEDSKEILFNIEKNPKIESIKITNGNPGKFEVKFLENPWKSATKEFEAPVIITFPKNKKALVDGNVIQIKPSLDDQTYKQNAELYRGTGTDLSQFVNKDKNEEAKQDIAAGTETDEDNTNKDLSGKLKAQIAFKIGDKEFGFVSFMELKEERNLLHLNLSGHKEIESFLKGNKDFGVVTQDKAFVAEVVNTEIAAEAGKEIILLNTGRDDITSIKFGPDNKLTFVSQDKNIKEFEFDYPISFSLPANTPALIADDKVQIYNSSRLKEFPGVEYREFERKEGGFLNFFKVEDKFFFFVQKNELGQNDIIEVKDFKFNDRKNKEKITVDGKKNKNAFGLELINGKIIGFEAKKIKEIKKFVKNAEKTVKYEIAETQESPDSPIIETPELNSTDAVFENTLEKKNERLINLEINLTEAKDFLNAQQEKIIESFKLFDEKERSSKVDELLKETESFLSEKKHFSNVRADVEKYSAPSQLITKKILQVKNENPELSEEAVGLLMDKADEAIKNAAEKFIGEVKQAKINYGANAQFKSEFLEKIKSFNYKIEKTIPGSITRKYNELKNKEAKKEAERKAVFEGLTPAEKGIKQLELKLKAIKNIMAKGNEEIRKIIPASRGKIDVDSFENKFTEIDRDTFIGIGVLSQKIKLDSDDIDAPYSSILTKVNEFKDSDKINDVLTEANKLLDEKYNGFTAVLRDQKNLLVSGDSTPQLFGKTHSEEVDKFNKGLYAIPEKLDEKFKKKEKAENASGAPAATQGHGETDKPAQGTFGGRRRRRGGFLKWLKYIGLGVLALACGTVGIVLAALSPVSALVSGTLIFVGMVSSFGLGRVIASDKAKSSQQQDKERNERLEAEKKAAEESLKQTREAEQKKAAEEQKLAQEAAEKKAKEEAEKQRHEELKEAVKQSADNTNKLQSMLEKSLEENRKLSENFNKLLSLVQPVLNSAGAGKRISKSNKNKMTPSADLSLDIT